MDVSKKECVVCHKPLTEHDDVVFCPECGAPYHRECYEKEGHCVFEEKHGSFSYESPKPKHTEEHAQGARCPNCGAENPQSANYCSKCGKKLEEPAPEEPEVYDAVPVQDQQPEQETETEAEEPKKG